MNDDLFAGSDPNVPASVAPSLDELAHRLGQRRRRQRIARASAFGSFAVGMIVLVLGARAVLSRPELKDFESNRNIAQSLPLESVPGPGSPQSTAWIETAASPPSATEMRVFAKVHQPIPIFDRVEDTEYLRHVGWIDSQQWVPVDLDQFPSEQRNTIRAVLEESSPSRFISL